MGAECDIDLVVIAKHRQAERLEANFREVYRKADTSGDGKICHHEFKELVNNNQIDTYMKAIEFDMQRCDGVFELLSDGDADGKISFEDFLSGVQRLQGPSKSIDVVMMANEQRNMYARVERIEHAIEHKLDEVHSLLR